MGAQNTQIKTARLWIAIELTSTQNGGSGADEIQASSHVP